LPVGDWRLPIENRPDALQRDLMLFNRQSTIGNRQ